MAIEEYHRADWFITFGSGEDVHFESHTTYYNEDGNKMHKFIMTPNNLIISNYNLEWGEEIDTTTGMIEQEYPDVFVRELMVTSLRSRFFVKCDLLGGETDQTKESQEKDNQIKVLQKQLRTAKAQIYGLLEENKNLVSGLAKKLKRDKMIFDYFRERRPVKEDEDESYEELQ